MIDLFEREQRPGFVAPATHAFAITPNDDADLSPVPRAIYVGGAGDLVVSMMAGGPPVTFVNVPSGIILPLRAIRVLEASTTTDMVLLT